MPNGERPSAAQLNLNDAHENEVDYIITRDESNHADRTAYCRNEQLTDDVTKRNEANEATRNQEFDWPNPAVSQKTQEKSSPNTDEGLKNDEKLSKRTLATENDAQNSPNRGDDIIVPEISENNARNESLSPRGGKSQRPNPNPKYSEDFRY